MFPQVKKKIQKKEMDVVYYTLKCSILFCEVQKEADQRKKSALHHKIINSKYVLYEASYSL